MSKVKKYVQMLAQTDVQTIEKIKLYENEGRFNEHLDTNPAPFIPVDEHFEYIPKNIFKKIDYSLKRTFFIKPFMKEANKLFQTIVKGKENLDGLKSAIICSNHINKLDCMVIQNALKPKTVYFTAAEFNNMQGFVGDMMRAGRLLPMSRNFKAQKNFLLTTQKLLKKGKFVTFFPESAEWWCYEKPRPQNSGAYNIAVKNNVPVLPIFFTFNQTEESKKSPIGFKQFVVNILKPIYPDPKLSSKENITAMMAKCQEQWQETYDNFYNKKEVKN